MAIKVVHIFQAANTAIVKHPYIIEEYEVIVQLNREYEVIEYQVPVEQISIDHERKQFILEV